MKSLISFLTIAAILMSPLFSFAADSKVPCPYHSGASLNDNTKGAKPIAAATNQRTQHGQTN